MPPKFKRKRPRSKKHGEQKDLVIKQKYDEEYAVANRILGGRIVECFCFDGTTRKAVIRGRIGKRNRIDNGTLLLLSLAEDGEGADVLHVYDRGSVRKLIKLSEIPDTYEGADGAQFDFMQFDSSDEKEEDINFDEI